MSADPREMTAEEYRAFFFDEYVPVVQEREAIQAETNGHHADIDDASLALASVLSKPTQDNVALLFEQRCGELFRYCKPWGKWLRWDGARWQEDNTDLAFDYVRRIARTVNFKGGEKMAAVSFANGVERYSRASRVFATEVDQWNKNDMLLNTPKGTVEL